MGLSKIRIALRLPAAFFLIVALSLGLMGYLTYSSAKQTLIESGEHEVRQIAEARAEALTRWSEEVATDLVIQSHNPLVSNATRSFAAAWQTLGPDAAERLRSLYVTGQGAGLEDPGDGSVYSRLHARFHSHFAGVARRGTYQDVLLFNPAGEVVYSLSKARDFASRAGDQGDIPLFATALRVLSGESAQDIAFVDFTDYAPAGEGSAFVVAPIRQAGDVMLGAIAFRLTTETISANLGRVGGLGDSGRDFAIGLDGKARTHAEGWSETTIEAGSPLESALNGESGVTHAQLTQGAALPMATGFAPADIFGQRWIFLVQIAEAEMLKAVSGFLGSTLTYGSIILALAAVIGTLIARSVTRPLRDLSGSISEVSREDYETPVPHVTRGDELGSISRSLEELRGKLLQSQAMQRDMAFQSAALDATSAALMITDDDFNITYMNDAVREMMRGQVDEFRKIMADFDPDKLIGVNMDIFHAKPEQIRALINHPDRLPFRTDIRVGDAHVQIELSAVWDSDRNFCGLVVEWVDVTEVRRRTAVLNAIDSGQIFAECDVEGKFLRLNDNFLKLAGASADSLVGRAFTEQIRLEGDDDQGRLEERVMAGETIKGRFILSRPGKEDALVEGGLYPILDRRGDASGMTLIGSDVTAAQSQLREAEARQQAMQAAQQSVVEALRIGMRDISSGDLTSRLNTPFAPEYEQLRTDFNDALENLTQAMANIARQTQAMHSETAEIVKAADEMSVRTERQALTLQDTASSLDELTTNIGQTADGAARANQVVTEARARAEESGSIVDEAETAMAEISASSKEIVKVISVIDDISFQTNLLALNAGVEAARAGEAGRGFAVVATEVRALAQRCANAAAEINQLITVSGQHVSRGVELVGVTGETLKKIVSSISEISDYIAEIAQAGKEQSIGLNQVNSAVNQIDHVTQQNAAMFEETTSASHALAHRANSLAETIGHFRVGDVQTVSAAEPRSMPRTSKGRAGVAAQPATQGNLAVAPRPAPEASDWEDF
ncbi:methyl-accepting chemotaxis protein [Oceanicola sp. S124]|uniref:methyl-accepting chemotaxis protein n=1 Tax=Oceanicola sp. S124 TaxID=1042378 RepID=UPI00025579C8|nr:methyl-accepting chemotaxis protein [Oceanicola sp. S124]